MRVRLTFSKTGALRYVGHLDLHKIWERSARRAGVTLAYSQGFHPQPKIQIASALPLGIASRCEVIDMWVEGDCDPQTLPAILQPSVPPGLQIHSAYEVDLRAPALQTQTVSAEYRATLLEETPSDGLPQRLEQLLATTTLPRERRGKTYDLRPLIEEVTIESDGKNIFMRLAAREGATGRPEAVLEELGLVPEDALIERTRLIFIEDTVE